MKSKDPNYAVKVEKAITEKYGEETVQHPKKSWNDEKAAKNILMISKDSISTKSLD